LIVYGYISTSPNPDHHSQNAALEKCGCSVIYNDSYGQRSERKALISQLKPLDMLIIWRLDKLSDNLADLLHMLEIMHQKNIHFKSLQEGLEFSPGIDNIYFQNLLETMTNIEKNMEFIKL